MISALDYRQLFDMVPAPLSVIARGYLLVAVNPRYCEVTGMDTDDVIGLRIFDAFPESDERTQLFAAAYDRAFAGEAVVLDRQHYALPTLRDGAVVGFEDRWWNVFLTPLSNPDGSIDRIVQVFHDCSAQVLSEQRSAAVTGELQHRIGNFLTLVGVMATRTFGDLPGGVDKVTLFRGRLAAMSHAARALTDGPGRCVTLRELAELHLEQFLDKEAGGGNRVTIAGPDFPLGADEAQGLSMAIYELTTNALKYGALRVPEGRLRVEWTRPAHGGFKFVWTERGAPAPEDPDRVGFGSVLLMEVVPAQVDGTASRTMDGDGVVYTLQVAAQRRTAVLPTAAE